MKKKLKGVYLNLDIETNLDYTTPEIEISKPQVKVIVVEPLININLKDKNKRKLF